VFCCVVFVSTVGNFGKDIVFGELALLYDAPRAATIKVTSTATVLWRIGRDVFKHLIRSAVQATSTQIMDTLNQVALLQPLTNDQKLQVSAKCQDPFVSKAIPKMCWLLLSFVSNTSSSLSPFLPFLLRT
jgi:hypothetical protein